MPDRAAAPNALAVAEVQALVNGITDPCSVGSGVPMGLVTMGIVDGIDVRGSRIDISLRPTMPGCLMLGFLEQAIRDNLRRLSWCTEVHVALSTNPNVWTEADMDAAARRLLRARRQSAADAQLR
jgi:metal-sulfur cluster biosynthetic enzyme